MWHALRALELDDTLAETHALLGMLHKVLEQTETMAAKAYVPPSTFALGHVGLEDWDAAFHWWDQAVEVRDPIVVPVKTFPFFDPVRGDPRYRAILRRMNLPED
jgi:serine/threonine-protein kinase